MTATLRPSQVAEAAGINVETLRYYERRGILPTPERSLGGHRLYSPDTVTALRVVKAAQRLGFSLDEVVDLLDKGRHHHANHKTFDVKTREKLAEIDQRIADLQVIRSTLSAAVEAGCHDLDVCATTAGCPIPFTELAQGASTSDHA